MFLIDTGGREIYIGGRDSKGYFDGGAIKFRLPEAAEAVKSKGINEIIFSIRPRDLTVSAEKPKTDIYLT